MEPSRTGNSQHKSRRRKTTSNSQRGPFTVDSGGGSSSHAISSSTPFIHPRGYEVFTTPAIGSLPVELSSAHLRKQQPNDPRRLDQFAATSISTFRQDAVPDTITTGTRPSLLSLQLQAGNQLQDGSKSSSTPEASVRAEALDQARAAAATAYAQTMATMLGGEPAQYLDDSPEHMRPSHFQSPELLLPYEPFGIDSEPFSEEVLLNPTLLTYPQISSASKTQLHEQEVPVSIPSELSLLPGEQRELFAIAKRQMPVGSSVESITRRMRDMALLNNLSSRLANEDNESAEELSRTQANQETQPLQHSSPEGRARSISNLTNYQPTESQDMIDEQRAHETIRGRSRNASLKHPQQSQASPSTALPNHPEAQDRSRSLMKYKPQLDRKTSFDHTVQHSQYAARTEQSPIRRLQKKRAAPPSPVVRPIDVPVISNVEKPSNGYAGMHGFWPFSAFSGHTENLHNGTSMSVPASFGFSSHFHGPQTPTSLDVVSEHQLYADYLAHLRFDDLAAVGPSIHAMHEQHFPGTPQGLDFANPRTSTTGYHTLNPPNATETINLSQIVPALAPSQIPSGPVSAAQQLFGPAFGMTPIHTTSPQLFAPWDQASSSADSAKSVTPPPSASEQLPKKAAKRTGREGKTSFLSAADNRSFSSPDLSELGKALQAPDLSKSQNNTVRKSSPRERGRQQSTPDFATSMNMRSVSQSAPTSPNVGRLSQSDTKKDETYTSGGATITSSNQQCVHCNTTVTPLWRRNPDGQSLCNACGLFLKLHGKDRPLSLKTDKIKRRNRATGLSKRSSVASIHTDLGTSYPNVLLDPHGVFAAEPLMMVTGDGSSLPSSRSSSRPSQSPTLHSRSGSAMSLSTLGPGMLHRPLHCHQGGPIGSTSSNGLPSAFLTSHHRVNSLPAKFADGPQ